uniref:Uncharacterized protein n=1 Tax=viral metagenome TaxID=1070528 RepID=A0A6M3LSC1_9ZZZZ
MNLFKVTLNYYGELHTFYTHTLSQSQALRNARLKLEMKLRKVKNSLIVYFNGDKDNFKVEKIS